MTTRSRLFLLLLPGCLVLCAALSAAPSETPKLWPVPADQPPVAYSGGDDPSPMLLHYGTDGVEVNRAMVLSCAALVRAHPHAGMTLGQGITVTEDSAGSITYLMTPEAVLAYHRLTLAAAQGAVP